MAVATVVAEVNRRTVADGSGGFISFGGSGAGPQNEPDVYYQLTSGTDGSASRKVGTNFGGLGFSDATTVDMTAADRTFMLFKIIATNKEALLTNGSPSMQIAIGDSDTTFYAYDVYGSDDYPIKGGFLLFPFNPNVAQYQTNSTTTPPTLTAIDFYGVRADFTGNSKVENVAIDAIDVGSGLRITGGDAGSASGTFLSFIDFDEGTLSNRYGFWSTVEGIIQVIGTNWVGRDTADATQPTGFEGSNQVLVFPYTAVDDKESSLRIDLGNANTTVNFINCTFVSKGTGGKIYFDNLNDVDATNNDIKGLKDYFVDGDCITMSNEGGTDTGLGYTDATDYFLGTIDASPNTNALALFSAAGGTDTTGGRTASLLGSSPVSLTQGNGEYWSMFKKPDNKGYFFVTGTAGNSLISGCSFTSFGYFEFTSAVNVENCVFTDTKSITAGGVATLYDSTFNDQYTFTGESLINTTDLNSITGCSFNKGEKKYGHAVEITTLGSDTSFDYKGNTFSGYGPTAQFFDSSDTNVVDTTNNTITLDSSPFVDGDSVYYSISAGTVITGLTDDELYYVRNQAGANEYSLHLNKGDALTNLNPQNITAVGVDNHVLYSGDAFIHNNSGRQVTISVLSGDIPTYRNSGISTTIVAVANTFTITNIQPGTEIRFIRNSDGFNYAGIEDVSLTNGDVTAGYGTSILCSDDPSDSSKRQLVYTYDASDTTKFGPAVSFTVKVFALAYEFETFGISSLANSGSQAVSQRVDRNYINR